MNNEQIALIADALRDGCDSNNLPWHVYLQHEGRGRYNGSSRQPEDGSILLHGPTEYEDDQRYRLYLEPIVR